MKIAFIGGGSMGTTYARAFVTSKIIHSNDLLIIDKDRDKLKKLSEDGVGNQFEEIDGKLKEYDVIFLAVKPQDFRKIAEKLRKYLSKKQLVISIMAGIKIKAIREALNHENVVRAMPNTPAQLGFGITGFTASKSVTQKTLSQVDTLLETTGKAIFMKDEKLIDAVTAISGSGPAYFFYFIKYMVEAGTSLGLEPHVSAMLVKQTMLGSFQMVSNTPLSLDELIKSVASKGGTTEAALIQFEKASMGKTIVKALHAAEKRAEEISKEFGT